MINVKTHHGGHWPDDDQHDNYDDYYHHTNDEDNLIIWKTWPCMQIGSKGGQSCCWEVIWVAAWKSSLSWLSFITDCDYAAGRWSGRKRGTAALIPVLLQCHAILLQTLCNAWCNTDTPYNSPWFSSMKCSEFWFFTCILSSLICFSLQYKVFFLSCKLWLSTQSDNISAGYCWSLVLDWNENCIWSAVSG